MNTITSLQDARAMKALGVPLSTPVRERTPSRLVVKHWSALEKYTRMMEATADQWLASTQETDVEGDKLWSLLNRRVQKLGKVFAECNHAVNRAAGNPVNTVGQYNEEQEARFAKALEADHSLIILVTLLPRVRDYLNFWQEFINEVSACKPGDSLNVAHLFGAPKVFEE